MSDSQISEIINGSLDLYEFIQVQPDASEHEIRRQYRRNALRLHPDKEGGDADKFNLLSKVYEILVDEELRKQYNEIRRIKKDKHIEQEKLLASTRRFQEELKRAEEQHRFNSDKAGDLDSFVQKRKWVTDLEKLKEEGLKRRRLHEQTIVSVGASQTQPVYVSYESIALPRQYLTSMNTQNTLGSLKIRWKHKPELREKFNADVLQKIMEIFGPIKSSIILPSKDAKARYDSGIIQYENENDTMKALRHNYKESANLWDGTSVRKLASLLRECAPVEQSDTGTKIMAHPRLPRSFKHTVTHNSVIDSILDQFTLRALDEAQ